MPSFPARLRLPGQSRLPLNVLVDISNERLTLTSGQETLGEWLLDGIDFEAKSDGFHIQLDQEEAVLSVTDSKRFARELAAVARTSSPPQSGNEPAKKNGISARLQSIDPEEQFDDLKGRVSALSNALTDDSIPPDEFFGRWLRLLKEINWRHGQGSMPTAIFYRLNTELLDLIPVPERRPRIDSGPDDLSENTETEAILV